MALAMVNVYAKSEASSIISSALDQIPTASSTQKGAVKIGSGLTMTGETLSVPVATTSANGLMSASDKTKLDNVASGANNYALPEATSSVLGGVKIGSGISVSSGVISISEATASASGLMSASDKAKLNNVAASANNYTLPAATSSVLGGVKIGSGISVSNGTISIPAATTSANGLMSASDKAKLNNVAASANNYTLPAATSSVLGGVKIGTGISVSSGVISISTATTSANGLMSSADKSKLDQMSDSNYVQRPTPTAFTIASNAWTKNESETSEFKYYADITATSITANDYVEINFTRASQSVTANANLCPSGETMSGKIRLYAESIPEDSISGEYVVTKGAV